MKDTPPLRSQIREKLGKLKPESTMCPGMLAKQFGTTQQALRPVYLAMARDGELRISQRGVEVADLEQLKGAYRLRLNDEAR